MPLPWPPQVCTIKNCANQEHLSDLCHTLLFLRKNLKSLKVIISLADLQVDISKGCKFWWFYWSTQARSGELEAEEFDKIYFFFPHWLSQEDELVLWHFPFFFHLFLRNRLDIHSSVDFLRMYFHRLFQFSPDIPLLPHSCWGCKWGTWCIAERVSPSKCRMLKRSKQLYTALWFSACCKY